MGTLHPVEGVGACPPSAARVEPAHLGRSDRSTERSAFGPRPGVSHCTRAVHAGIVACPFQTRLQLAPGTGLRQSLRYLDSTTHWVARWISSVRLLIPSFLLI